VVGVVLKDAAVPELKTENFAESVVEVVPTSKLPELSILIASEPAVSNSMMSPVTPILLPSAVDALSSRTIKAALSVDSNFAT
jgi:hypothetical protein